MKLYMVALNVGLHSESKILYTKFSKSEYDVTCSSDACIKIYFMMEIISSLHILS